MRDYGCNCSSKTGRLSQKRQRDPHLQTRVLVNLLNSSLLKLIPLYFSHPIKTQLQKKHKAFRRLCLVDCCILRQTSVDRRVNKKASINGNTPESVLVHTPHAQSFIGILVHLLLLVLNSLFLLNNNPTCSGAIELRIDQYSMDFYSKHYLKSQVDKGRV